MDELHVDFVRNLWGASVEQTISNRQTYDQLPGVLLEPVRLWYLLSNYSFLGVRRRTLSSDDLAIAFPFDQFAILGIFVTNEGNRQTKPRGALVFV